MRTGNNTPAYLMFSYFSNCGLLILVSAFLASCATADVVSRNYNVPSIPMVSFVFDDGNDTDYLVGKEIFASHGAVASSAITTGFLNTEDHMTTAQVIALQSAGWEIMGHTVSHPNLKSLSPSEIEDEISRSKSDLQRMGLVINNIVYPYNKNDEVVRSIVSKYYRSGRGGTNSFNSSVLDPFFIKSFSMKHDVEKMKALIDAAYKDKKWLVFYQHEIDAKVKIADYAGAFLKGEKLILSPSGAVGRYVTTHWFPVYGYAIYLVPFSGTPQPGDTVKGERSGATARIGNILYNEREQLSDMLGYIQKSYPDMQIVTIDKGLDLLGVPKQRDGAYDKR
jgi:peptidoglycan/xylan/chitin deacetylase (PgdA/CDA1 family)